MLPYWLNVAGDPQAPADQRALAGAVNKLRPFLVSDREEPVPWPNAELLVVHDDEQLADAVRKEKAEAGKGPRCPRRHPHRPDLRPASGSSMNTSSPCTPSRSAAASAYSLARPAWSRSTPRRPRRSYRPPGCSRGRGASRRQLQRGEAAEFAAGQDHDPQPAGIVRGGDGDVGDDGARGCDLVVHDRYVCLRCGVRHGPVPGAFELLHGDLLAALRCQAGVHLGDAPGEQGADSVLGVLAPGRPRLGFGGPARIFTCQDELRRLLEPGGVGRAAAVAEQGGHGPATASGQS